MITEFKTMSVPVADSSEDFKILVADSDSVQTPKSLFNAISERFGGFNLDIAATRNNTLCDDFLVDAMFSSWRTADYKKGRCWCNPPYSAGILDLVEKADYEIRLGNAELVVMLVQFDPSTAGFYKAMQLADEIIILTGRRIRFLGRYCKYCKSHGRVSRICEQHVDCRDCVYLSKNTSSRMPHCLIVFRRSGTSYRDENCDEMYNCNSCKLGANCDFVTADGYICPFCCRVNALYGDLHE